MGTSGSILRSSVDFGHEGLCSFLGKNTSLSQQLSALSILLVPASSNNADITILAL